ncbi:MAG: alpha/beta hydrolase [Candidatus Lokiarchaeota archaeon]|nr:alpha/beta hydrolase [Candidatus Lokiarchaeota archaeon]
MAPGEGTGDIESGKFDGKIPYVRVGRGNQRLVYFSGGGAFLTAVDADGLARGKAKARLLAPNQTMYILGYPRGLRAGFELDDLASELAGTIRNHLGRSTIIGNSFGGMIAIAYAAKFPDLTEKFVLTNSAYAFSPGFVDTLQEIVKLGERGKVFSAVLKMNDLISRPWLRGLANVGTWLSWPRAKRKLNPISELTNALGSAMSAAESLKAHLPAIKARAVVIGGTADKAHSEALFRETASLIPGAKLVLFPGFGHEMEMEHGKEFRDALQENLG